MGSQGKVDRIRAQIRDSMPELRERYGVMSVAIFGSVVRGTATPSSDIDLLVQFEGDPPGLMGFIGLERRLAEVLGRPVDLVMETALKPRLRERILAEAVAA